VGIHVRSPLKTKVTVKAWNQQAADQSVSAMAVVRGYCKRDAKDTRADGQFLLTRLFLCLQWDTRDTTAQVSTSSSGLSVVGIRSDTSEELIDSARRTDVLVIVRWMQEAVRGSMRRIIWPIPSAARISLLQQKQMRRREVHRP
jgi:hypothetical protein